MSRVGVLGAGPAGLLASLCSAEAGHDVVLFEAAERVGGMAGSFEVSGQRVDFGSHRLHPATDPVIMARLKNLLGEDLQLRERNGRIRLRGRWVGFPLRMVDMARSLPLDFSLGVAKDTLTGPIRKPSGSTTFAAEIERRLGPTIRDEFYGPYAHKLYGVAADRLDAELADRRVAATSPLQILQRVLKAARSEGRSFWYPVHGYGQLCERLADAAVDAGVDIRLSSLVTEIGVGGASVRSDTTTVATDVVLSSLPVAVLPRLLVDETPDEVHVALDSLRTRGMVLVYLTVGGEQYTPYDAHYFPEPDVGMSRLSEPKNYRTGPDPRGTTVLCGEYACWPTATDPLWAARPADLQARMVSDLERSGLPVPEVVAVHVERLPSVYPVYEPGADANRQLIDRWLQELDGILAFGRQGLWVPDNIHHVLSMGSTAAAVVTTAGELDRGAWSDALARFDDHVVQD